MFAHQIIAVESSEQVATVEVPTNLSLSLSQSNESNQWCAPRFIIFTSELDTMEIDDFKNFTINDNIAIIVDNFEIFSCSLSLCTKLVEVIKTENKFIVEIPNFLFTGVEIKNNSNISIKIDTINWAVFSREILMKYFTCEQINNSLSYSTTSFFDVNNLYRADNTSTFKGFFIECDVCELTQIKIRINDTDIICYNDIMIRLLCNKISEKLIYVPFNNDVGYEDISNIVGYCGAKTVTHMDTVKMTAVFDGNSSIKIYAMCK